MNQSKIFIGGAFKNGLACVSIGNPDTGSAKWGFMDTTGKLVVPCIYDAVGDVSEGYGLTIMQLGEDSWNAGYIKMDK